MDNQFQAVLHWHFQRFICFLRVSEYLGVKGEELAPSPALCIVWSFERLGITVEEKKTWYWPHEGMLTEEVED